MKFLAFSDLHAHPHRFGGVIDPDTGRHSRLQDCLDVLDKTAQEARNLGCRYRFFIGDMFHVRGRLAPSVLNPVIEHYRSEHTSSFERFIDVVLVGNHDMESRQSGEHALRAIPNCTVLEGHGFMGLHDVYVGWVAYDPDVKEIKKRIKEVCATARMATEDRPKIFLLHHGVNGVMPNIPDCGISSVDLPHEDFDYILCGDYHKHAEIIPDKAWMIGAPLQHNFGDAGDKRGWMIFDTEEKLSAHQENGFAPQFVTWAEGDPMITGDQIKGNFVRFRHSDLKVLDELENLAIQAGTLAVQKEPVRDWKAAERADIDISMTTSQLFKVWLEKQPIGQLEPGHVIATNEEVLQEAGVA